MPPSSIAAKIVGSARTASPRACDHGHMAYMITTTDGQTYECGEVGHQVDGSVSIQVGGRKLRLASHYWQVIEGEPGDEDVSQRAR